MCKFRTLKASEIEVRLQSNKNGKATHLLYIDSRAVTNLLDETVGSMNWQSEFYEVAGQTICRIGIWDKEKGCFIYKSDTGSESNIEGEKGKISDCYKRCLSRWGVTELYTAPRIQLDDDGYGNSGYSVREININDARQITHIVLVNRFGEEVFRWDKGEQLIHTRQQPTQAQPKAQTTQAQPQSSKKQLTLAQAKAMEEQFIYWLYNAYKANPKMSAMDKIAEYYDCDFATKSYLSDKLERYLTKQ